MTMAPAPRLELGCLALGVTVLAGTLWTIGAETLVRDLRTMGWSLAAILLVESASVALNTVGWAAAFPAGERPVGAARLFGARLAGDASTTSRRPPPSGASCSGSDCSGPASPRASGGRP